MLYLGKSPRKSPYAQTRICPGETEANTNIRRRSERELLLQIFQHWNGSFFYADTLVREVKQIDRRYSGKKVLSELRRLATSGQIEVEIIRQVRRYGVTDPSRPLRLYPGSDNGKPGVQYGQRDPHEDIIPFELWEE